MRKYYEKFRSLASSGTALDIYTLFIGNLGSAFWGFVFTLIAARALSIQDFGVFSATLNFVIILSSLADIGISTGSVNFVSEYMGRGETEKANEYIKASFIIRVLIILFITLIVLIFSPLISISLLATNDYRMAIWAAAITIFLFPIMFFPNILQAKKKFLNSTVMDNAFYFSRLVFAFGFYLAGALTMTKAFWGFGVGFVISLILTFVYVGKDFMYSKPDKEVYKKLLTFSGWIAVNRIISSISGKLDIQMLAAMSGAVATGLYSIPSRLASFIIVLAGSLSSVLATRLASFGDKDKERSYIVKSTLALIPVSLGIVFWIIIGEPFVVTLFGAKYLTAVPIFQALAAAMIPFLFTVPAVTAIIYAMKKTVYIGALSFFQLAAVFLLNYYFIPLYGPLGPTITLGVTNIILALYVWSVVIKYYWGKNS